MVFLRSRKVGAEMRRWAVGTGMAEIKGYGGAWQPLSYSRALLSRSMGDIAPFAGTTPARGHLTWPIPSQPSAAISLLSFSNTVHLRRYTKTTCISAIPVDEAPRTVPDT